MWISIYWCATRRFFLLPRILSGLGFDADVPEAAILAGKIPGEYLFKRAGVQQIVGTSHGAYLSLLPAPHAGRGLFTRRRRVLCWMCREVPALCLEDETWCSTASMARSISGERLMWPADIAAIVARHPEIAWERVRNAARDVGAERMVHVGLLLAESLLGVPVPAEMAAKASADGAARDLVRQVESWLPAAGYKPPPLHQRAMFG